MYVSQALPLKIVEGCIGAGALHYDKLEPMMITRQYMRWRINLTYNRCVEACGACSGAAKEDQAPIEPTAQYTFEGPVGSELELGFCVLDFCHS